MNTITTINGKQVLWALTVGAAGPATSAHLIANGFTPETYYGESIPTGRQIKRFGLFHKVAATGEFVLVHAM